eukprot:snap_masked-scaffold_10-processed-gene-2.9-mRNA-1 protein AED:0.79 eAED:1.00 QI:0/0/0/0.5/1/1/2/0/61
MKITQSNFCFKKTVYTKFFGNMKFIFFKLGKKIKIHPLEYKICLTTFFLLNYQRKKVQAKT